jgi:succinate dehydrogenase / fumarate reductase membrane anchor subunit
VEALVKSYRKNPVGAHYGIGDWLLQRLTAVVMAAYTIVALVLICSYAPASQADWRALFSGAVFRPFTMVFVASLLYHAWVGMRDVIMDYVKPTGIRLLLQTGIVLVLLFYLVWCASILWSR